jgi:Rhomboid family
MFLHLGVLHLALNMWALWNMGQLTEKLYGSGRFCDRNRALPQSANSDMSSSSLPRMRKRRLSLNKHSTSSTYQARSRIANGGAESRPISFPKWQSAEDRISATQLPADSRLAPLRGALLEYLDQKRFALDLLSDAARYDDPEKLEWGRQVSNRNNAKAEQIKALIRQVY